MLVRKYIQLNDDPDDFLSAAQTDEGGTEENPVDDLTEEEEKDEKKDDIKDEKKDDEKKEPKNDKKKEKKVEEKKEEEEEEEEDDNEPVEDVVQFKVGNDIYNVDAKSGNLVDKEGKVVLEKKELDKLRAEEDSPADNRVVDIDAVIDNIGYEFKGEDGKPKKYDGTVDGLVEYAKDLGNRYREEAENELFKQFPDVREYLVARANGMDAKTFFNTFVSEDIGVDDINDETPDEVKVNIIIADLVNKNVPAETAKTVAESYKTAGILTDKAKEAQPNIKNYKTSKIAEMEKANEKAIRDAEKAQRDLQLSVDKIVQSGNIDNEVFIKEAEKNDFHAYLFNPVGPNGETQELLDIQAQRLEDKLKASYLRFKKATDPDIKEKKSKKQTRNKSLGNKIAKLLQTKNNKPIHKDVHTGDSVEAKDFDAVLDEN